ncbi:MAG: murein L,D-transpeptidase catalytic domain family protein [Tannerellaceae bacterium]|nr:murein L,D-transpeptidase catalytic domain family protein [Tannerellaceae bacterium]
MNKLLIALLLLLQFVFPVQFNSVEKTKVNDELLPDYLSLYHEMQLDGIIDLKAFQQAVEGYKKVDPENKELITLIDYTKPPTEKQMFVLDLEEKKILHASHVLHGRNSGYTLPTSFSNEVNSNKSSLGFFVTEGTYHGKYGYSLVINGLEKGINDKAKERAIVIHGSKYADPKVLTTAKRIPRSLGCPAIPYDNYKEIIDAIKGGSLVYIYADSEEYIQKSQILDEIPFIS